MKRHVQILLIFASLVPALAGAREETMEERKQRITRKYLRERAEITYSDMAVPDAEADIEEVLASEKFKQPQVDLQRQEGRVSAMLPPPVRRPAPRVENSNWLLSEKPELDDPYADPFALKDSSDKSKKKADWATWETDRNTETQRESRFNPRGSYDPSANQQTGSYGSTQRGFFNPRDPRSESAGGLSSGFQQEGSAWGSRSLFGQSSETQPSATMNTLDLSRDEIFNSTRTQTRLNTPFSRVTESQSGRLGFGSRTQLSPTGYTPYKSSFQTQREQRQQQWGNFGNPQQEFQKQNTFQQWKERNPVRYDPTADDAFIQEMMPKTRR